MIGPPSDSLRGVYDERASLQYADPVPLPDPRVDRKFERMTSLLSETLPAESLLDAGCGDGRFLAAAARLPSCPTQLTGVDISDRILDTARRTLEREGVTATLVRANLEQLPFRDASFARVLSVQVIEHLLDVRLGLRELARVLEPGGMLVLSTDNAANGVSRVLNSPRRAVVRALRLTGRHTPISFPHRTFAIAEVVDLVREVRLEIDHVETFRFQLDGIHAAPVQRLLNAVDRLAPPHGFGDIVAVVARKPR